ncbi:MAG: cation-translocating P-type ATPase, partial [Clostridia bacterium]|nr:cation-translocating P-type ATPase [Clostridia bacterium]
MTKQELFSKYGSSEKGLSNAQAKENIKFGTNNLSEHKKDSFIKKFFLQFKNLMVIILLISAIVSTIVSLASHEYGELFEGALIFVIVILNAIIGVIQENKAEVALSLLSQQASPKSRVFRDGNVCVINSNEVVCGDLVLLKSGEEVPADIFLTESVNLKTDESSLTGESQPVEKSYLFASNTSTPVAEKANICFKGTSVTSGNAKGIVVAVGKSTEMGKIAKLLTTKQEKTPLEKNMERIGKVITYGVLIVVAIVFLSQLIFSNNIDFMQAFLTAIALAVAAIPESLPAVITIIMALGVEKLAKHGAIVKTLSSVETLGSCTCICTDKTGTLTENKMTVKSLYFDNAISTSNFCGNTFNLLLTAVNCCNNASLSDCGYNGDATEVSLKNFVEKHSPQLLSAPIVKLNEIPFNSARKIMSTLNKINNDTYVFSKGALDFLISKCSHILINNNIEELNSKHINNIQSAHKKLANLGERIIAVAYKQSHVLTENNLVFLGLVGIIDPPRPQVLQSINQCFTAGLKPIMITGDHPDTAFAIAKQLNIATQKQQVITGEQIDKLSSKELSKTINNYCVFARVSPTHKTQIVKALKHNGHIVGFTGDGINDAPSVKMADIGVCMGSGTDVTKSSADLIISTNDYSTIILAIKQGRTIYTNIQKTLLFLLSTNIVEVLGLLVSALVLPNSIFLLPSQILFINLVTDSLPAFALGLEKAEKDIMQKPPRNPKSTIFSGIGWHILLQGFSQTFVVLIMFVVALNLWGNSVASTMVFITICLMQILHAINCKTLRSITKVNIVNNKTFNLSFVALLALILVVALT